VVTTAENALESADDVGIKNKVFVAHRCEPSLGEKSTSRKT
jgi:hypothetical protein